MQRDDVMEMASECGLILTPEIEKFAQLLAKGMREYMVFHATPTEWMKEHVLAEREACAMVCDDYATYGGTNFNEWFIKLSADIRARGEA